MTWGLYALAGWRVAGAVLTAARPGKEYEPCTRGAAIGVLMICAGWVTLLVITAGRIR